MREGKKRGAERTQIATRNEEWSDERLKTFLSLQPPQDMSADYNVLLKAYRGMTAGLFARFIPLFVEDGRDLDATLADGSTILDLVSRHRRSTAYAEILRKAGATARSARPVKAGKARPGVDDGREGGARAAAPPVTGQTGYGRK